jgi:hypothetical protein
MFMKAGLGLVQFRLQRLSERSLELKLPEMYGQHDVQFKDRRQSGIAHTCRNSASTRYELPKAVTSGFHASFSNRSKALL